MENKNPDAVGQNKIFKFYKLRCPGSKYTWTNKHKINPPTYYLKASQMGERILGVGGGAELSLRKSMNTCVH